MDALRKKTDDILSRLQKTGMSSNKTMTLGPRHTDETMAMTYSHYTTFSTMLFTVRNSPVRSDRRRESMP